MAVLYRKHRPQRFGEVVGQNHVTETLKHQVASGTPAHAYLFTGGRGMGKTSVARILAKALNCPAQKDGEPCGSCEVCTQIQDGRYLDLVEVDAASHTGVDNVRELTEHVRFAPSAGAYKVFIIDEAHMLSKGAFNALLKTLEEPPAHAVFILATTEIGKVPATVASRCQRFDFRPLTKDQLAAYLDQIAELEGMDLSGAGAAIAARAQGSVRDALTLLSTVAGLGPKPDAAAVRQLIGAGDVESAAELLDLVLSGSAPQLPEAIHNFSNSGVNFASLNRDVLELLRLLLGAAVTGAVPAHAPAEVQGRLSAWKERASAADVLYVARLFLRAEKDLEYAAEPDLPVLLASVEAALKRSGQGSVATGRAAPNAAAAPVSPPPPQATEVPPAPALSSKTVEPEQPTVPDVPHLDIAAVRGAWLGLVDMVKAENATLGNLLRSCSPSEVDDFGRAVVSVRFPLHKQSIESHKSQQLIASCFTAIVGQPVQLRAVVEQRPAAESETPGSVERALEVFGGELVES